MVKLANTHDSPCTTQSARCPAPYVVLGQNPFMQMYYVYILQLNNGQLYNGRTDDLKRRFSEHKEGKVKSTKHRRPLRLLFYEAFFNKLDTIRRERYFKTSKGKSTIRMMLRATLQNNVAQ